MKSIFIYILFSFFCFAKIFAQADKNVLLVEAESFQFKGGWLAEPGKGPRVLGNTILRVLSGKVPASDALTIIQIKDAANYNVWVRSADYPTDKPGTRLYKLLVDEQSMLESGKHGKEGYYWEKVGVASLAVGKHLLRLKDTRSNFARCDAILFAASEAFDPNTNELDILAKFRIIPEVEKSNVIANTTNVVPTLLATNAVNVAEIGNAKIRLRFLKNAIAGNSKLAAKTDIKTEGDWLNMNPFYEDHKIYLLTSNEPGLSYGNFFPSWNGSRGYSSFSVNGKDYSILEPENAMNPFMAGNLIEAYPVEAKKINDTTIEVKYNNAGSAAVVGLWTIGKNNAHINITLQCKVQQAGYYSLGVAAFQSTTTDKTSNILLPPMFQYKRISPQPVMLTSAMMQQPLAIAETKIGTNNFALFISGDITSFPLDWGSAYAATMGFAIKNELNNIQPVAFSPVLGLNDSKLTAGQTIEKKFVVGAVAAGWNEALEYVSEQVFKVKDYRTQKQASLTDAVFNMIDLIKNDDAAGWDKNLKGFYDIEADPKTAVTVVQASPLTLVSTAVITKDEDFYIKRALPTIEYTLSRSGFRWAKGIVPTSFNNTKKTLLLSPYNSQFTTSYYEGLNKLMGEANPWLASIALPEGRIRNTNGYSITIPMWGQELAAYRLTKDSKWLTLAKTGADKFITEQVYNNTTKPLTKQPFYNASFYAYWWDLIDLYEETQDGKYLSAAETTAFHTIAGVRSFPQVKDSMQTINIGNKFDGTATLWWKGDKKYRLGFPRVAGDAPEKQVEQKLVSPVGLGFEQPYTYIDAGSKTVHPVYMNTWAPHLLRLYQYTKRPIFNTYARNAVIGRFTNYPGYYASGFTDIPMQPDFPYKGPDVSSIYYHHIPPHLAFSWDYLISEAIQRSNGKVNFPYGKQDGFVWFTNRLYGAGNATIYEDKQAHLWMKKGLVTINSPEVNYITAVSSNKFWVILMNESDKNLPVKLSVTKDVSIKENEAASIYMDDKSKPVSFAVKDRLAAVTLSSKGIVAISFPLKDKNEVPVLTPIKDGMKVEDMGGPWGKVYLFRIRSPFGWDSIYGYAETSPIDGAIATVSCNGETVTKNAYPFEWSFYKIKSQENAVIKLELKTSDGKIKETTIQLNGNN